MMIDFSDENYCLKGVKWLGVVWGLEVFIVSANFISCIVSQQMQSALDRHWLALAVKCYIFQCWILSNIHKVLLLNYLVPMWEYIIYSWLTVHDWCAELSRTENTLKIVLWTSNTVVQSLVMLSLGSRDLLLVSQIWAGDQSTVHRPFVTTG